MSSINYNEWPELTSAVCIYRNGVPSERLESGYPLTYTRQHDAERKIVERLMEQLKLFLSGERTFEEAFTVQDYIVEVTVSADGSIVDEEGNCFERGNWSASTTGT